VKSLKVLDLGCWDETAIIKQGTKYWLRNEICNYAKLTIGIDNSDLLPKEENELKSLNIIKGDCTDEEIIGHKNIDVIVAGELIEHLPNALHFFQTIKKLYPGKMLIISTPNATSISNTLLGLFSRESMHKDHLNIFSYKTLFSLCKRSLFLDFEIIPTYVQFAELKLSSKFLKKNLVIFSEKIINLFEYLFPLLSGGYLVVIKI
jgi:hypothetical protein